jgi:acetoacetyl-CoA reductase
VFQAGCTGLPVVTTYSPGNKKVEAWLATTKDMGYDFKAYECDVADYDSAQACIAKIQAEVGPSTCWSTTPASRAT